jgi:hypothetical protein
MWRGPKTGLDSYYIGCMSLMTFAVSYSYTPHPLIQRLRKGWRPRCRKVYP